MAKRKSMRLSKKKKGDYLFCFIMLLIPVIHFIIFWVIVNFNSIALSFQRMDITTGKTYFTFDNFSSIIELFKTNELKVALLNTLLTSGFQIVFLLPWSFVLSYFLYKKIPLTGVWRVFLFLPSILPAIFLTGMFKYAISTVGGSPIGSLWEAIFHEQIPSLLVESQYARWTVLIYFFLTNFGGQFILFSGAMSRIPKETLEAAKLDGVGTFREMFTMILPMVWPTFSMILILNVASIFTATGPILLLTKGQGETSTIAYWIFDNVNKPVASLYLPAALGLACTAVLYPIITFVRWGLGKIYKDVEY
jgi:ABC-type sugar transport system permease subunit